MATQKHTHWWWIKKASAEDGDAWLATLSEEDFDYLLKLKKQYDCMCFPMRKNVKKEMDRREEEAKNKKLSKIAASKAPRRTTGDKAVFNAKLADEKKVLPRNKRDEKASAEDSGEDSDFLEVISSGVVSSSSSLSTPKRQCFTTPTQCPGAPSRGDQVAQGGLLAILAQFQEENKRQAAALEAFYLAQLASSSSSAAAAAAPVVAPANDDVNMYDDDDNNDLIRSRPTAAAAPRSASDALVASIVEAAAEPASAPAPTPGAGLFTDEELVLPEMSPFPAASPGIFSPPRRRSSHDHEHRHRHRSVSRSPRALFQTPPPAAAAASPPVLTLASLVAAASDPMPAHEDEMK